MTANLVFERASLLCYRLFDIADSIDLNRAHALLAQRNIRRMRLTREGSQYLELPNPPIALGLGPRPLEMRAGTFMAEVTARIFDHGAASLTLDIPIAPGTPLEAVLPLVDELQDSPVVDALALAMLNPLRQQLAPVLDDAHLWSAHESYTVVFSQMVRGAPSVEQMLESDQLPLLILGESQAASLSSQERKDVLEQRFSYTAQDLAVIDWNGAFVHEPSGSRDIPDLLEIANAQLLELRYYDDVLDGQLQLVGGQMARSPRRWYSIFWSPYRATARRLLLTLLELNEFVERVENSLKIVGDFYLAKVYEGALQQLRIHAWQKSVTRKQKLLAETYDLLKGEIDTDRVLTLDVMIVFLIVVELLVALYPLLRH